jgi:hypothetical protein
MATYINPLGAPRVAYSGRINYTHDELAASCRFYGSQLHVPQGMDGAQLLWAIAGKESSFGANCTPRHESAYCTGKYSRALITETQKYGHSAHCSFSPWQLLYANTPRHKSPDLTFASIDDGAAAVVTFLNYEILGRQRATTIEDIADAYNTGNFRDAIIPSAYVAAVVSNYHNVPMPAVPVISVHASGIDAQDLYNDLNDAIEGLGMGIHPGALVGVPLQLLVDDRTLTVSEHRVQWTSDERGKRIDCITLKAN